MKNKTGAIIRIICFSFLALLLTGILIAGIMKKDFSFDFNLFNFGFFSSNNYENADKYTAGNIEITPTEEGLKDLNINWIDGNVKVIPYDGTTISVSETAHGTISKEDSVHTYYHDGILDIQYSQSNTWSFGISNRATSKQLEVRIPLALCTNLQTIETSLVSANAEISDITANSLITETVSGEITYTGEINLVDCESVSGNISISSAATPKEISTDTVSGDVTLGIPDSSQFEAELDSVSGNIRCDFDTTSSSLEDNSGSLTCGNGNDGSYEFDSVSGDVTIQ